MDRLPPAATEPLTSMKYWSAACWAWLHTCGRIRPETVGALAAALPCRLCGLHLLAYLAEHPVGPPVDLWLLDFHNAVNVRLGKPITVRCLADVDSSLKTSPRPAAALGRFLLACAFVHEHNSGDFSPVRRFLDLALQDTGIAPFEAGPAGSGFTGRLYAHLKRQNVLDYGSFDDVVDAYVPEQLREKVRATTGVGPVIRRLRHHHTFFLAAA